MGPFLMGSERLVESSQILVFEANEGPTHRASRGSVTSSALKHEAIPVQRALTGEYQWWPVPTMPPSKVENRVQIDQARGSLWC